MDLVDTSHERIPFDNYFRLSRRYDVAENVGMYCLFGWKKSSLFLNFTPI